jgi:dihydrofolate reductase
VAAGLLDEMTISLVPAFLGGGTRLFENLGAAPRRPEHLEAIEAPGVTHLRYRFV